MGVRLGVIVVNYASSALLAHNLVTVSQEVPDADIFVVDNWSSGGERDAVAALCTQHGWHLIAPPDNKGFGGGVNSGAEAAFAAGCGDILMLNPDARISASAIDLLRAEVDDQRMTLASPIVVEPSGRQWFAGSDLYLDDGETRSRRRRPEHPGADRVEWLSGACLIATREIWDATGGFDDAYFLYWEDVDLSRRVADAGGRLVVVTDAEAVHDEGATHRAADQRAEAKSETYYYYNIRNRMLFAVGHLDAAGIRRWLRSSRAHAWQVLLRGGRRQFVHPVAPLRAAMRGLRDGRTIARAALRGEESRI